MKRNSMFLAAVGAAVFGTPIMAAETLREAIKESGLIVDWRVRYENVDQAGFVATAEAFTSRLRAGFQTAELGGTSLLAEAVWIEDIVDDYDSTTNGATGYPVVADPDSLAINRFALTNKSLENATLSLGRQRIVLDDARFVGNVGWRQNEQTFDGMRAQLGRGALTADLTYADQVNRIFGPDSAAGEWQGELLLAHVARTFDWGKLIAFGYLLEFDNVLAMSSNTYGLKVTGSRPLGGLTGTYAAAYARQSAGGANPLDYDEHYYLLEAGLNLSKTAVALGRELLGGDGRAAFATPLATLHAFQGWADKFLATPAWGVEDTYLKVSYSLGNKGPFTNLSAVVFLHALDADADSTSYGDELDLSLVGQLSRMTFTLKYASYDADSLFTDTDKLWLSMDYTF